MRQILILFLPLLAVACQSTPIVEPMMLTPYQCGKYSVDVNYPQDTAVAHIDEDVYTLDRTASGSGVKFQNKPLNDDDPTVIFWMKGQESHLFLDERPGVSCKQTTK